VLEGRVGNNSRQGGVSRDELEQGHSRAELIGSGIVQGDTEEFIEYS
jgi:hypothetical protein